MFFVSEKNFHCTFLEASVNNISMKMRWRKFIKKILSEFIQSHGAWALKLKLFGFAFLSVCDYYRYVFRQRDIVKSMCVLLFFGESVRREEQIGLMWEILQVLNSIIGQSRTRKAFSSAAKFWVNFEQNTTMF